MLKRRSFWEHGASGALIATIVPTLILAVAVVHDVGALMAAKRWGQSVVDAAVANGAMQLSVERFEDEGNIVALDTTAAARAQRWVEAHNIGGGGAPVGGGARVPQISCPAATVDADTLRVSLRCTVNTPVLFPPLFRALGYRLTGAGAVAVPVFAEAQFQYGITERMTR
jgi:uncharacterized membrane protein